MRTEKQLLRDLKKVVEMDNTNENLIAYKMGYRSNLTPRAWLRRQSIPTWCVNRLDDILENILVNKKETTV